MYEACRRRCMEIILYYHYPLCNRTHQNRFEVSIFGSSAVQGHESDNGDMYSSESSWGDIPPLVEGGYAHFWKKSKHDFSRPSWVLHWIFEIFAMNVHFCVCLLCGIPRFPPNISLRCCVILCIFGSVSIEAWIPVSALEFAIWAFGPYLRCYVASLCWAFFFFDMTCQDLGKCHAILEHFFFPPKFTRDLSNEWNQGCWW